MRSTVATTRSKRRSRAASATGAGYPQPAVATPLVSVLLAARDAETTVAEAVESVLGQTNADLELLVVDDGSVDGTGDVLGAVDDARLRVIRNREPLGLAGALNVGLDAARGSYVARMDADDVALPGWLERTPRPHPLGSDGGRGRHGDDRPAARRRTLGTVHRMPVGARAVRWAALFSSPFFHPTVLVDRAVLDRHGLRYDTSFAESEDYDLWARLLSVAEGDNVPEPLVCYRKHPGQASARRAALQRECQQRVALAQIERLCPQMHAERVELAWLVGARRACPTGPRPTPRRRSAQLVDAFERSFGGDEARRAAARALAAARGSDRDVLVRAALRLDPGLPRRAIARARSRRADRAERRAAERWLRRRSGAAPIALTIVLPEPTPYRSPMLERLAERPELDLTAIYAGGSVQRRVVGSRARAPRRGAGGPPGSRRRACAPARLPHLLRRLRRAGQVRAGGRRGVGVEHIRLAGRDRVVSSPAGAVRAARRVERPRRTTSLASWREASPRPLGGARRRRMCLWSARSRENRCSRVAPTRRGSTSSRTRSTSPPSRDRVDALQPRRDAFRAEIGLGADDVVVLSVARLAPEKGLDTLVRAVAAADDPRLVLVVAGAGPERERLADLARREGVRLELLPHVEWERIAERYLIADVFALLSTHEPWGVVVNEAAASGLPLVLSDHVGAAYDLLEDGRNGLLVPAGDPAAAGEAIRALAADPEATCGDGRGFAGDRERLGLRAEHREPRPRRQPGRRRSGHRADCLPVDSDLLRRHVVPRRA